jgi:bifunctional ADP-heptose synthase (sugar kinase/adenylyltransferase)
MKKKERIIITSGEFDFLDYEAVKFLKACRSKGDWLIVGLHTDMFMELCRGGYKHSYEERVEMISNISCVDEIFRFNDGDGTVCNLLKIVKHCYPMSDITYVSDIDMKNMPETKIRGITFEIIKQE